MYFSALWWLEPQELPLEDPREQERAAAEHPFLPSF